MKRMAYAFAAILLVSCQPGKVAIKNEKIMNVDQKVEALLSQMTLEEKVGQMNLYNGTWDVTGPAPQGGDSKEKFEHIKKGWVGAMLNVLSAEDTRAAQELAVNNSRLKIPMLFGYDVIHGYKTMFPIPLGEAASWDMEVLRKGARVAAIEAAANGINWTFAPMVDISRDARWGRVMEGAGEDPYLGCLAAKARVEGFQGSDLSADNTIAACAKHFASYGFAEAGRDYNTVEISEHTMRNIVLPPFKAAADAGVATFMNAFNDVNGIPATGNAWLQRDILKGEWKYQGFMVSDWASVREMVDHGHAADKAEAARKAANAGSDMDMEGYCFVEELANQVRAGKVPESLIDDAVRRILRIKHQLGLFDDPYRYCNAAREKERTATKEHMELARDAARKSIVLLKNEGNVLPLRKDAKRIAVIGPLAADKDVPLGSWRAQAETNSAVSLLEGIQAAVRDASAVSYTKGCDLAVGQRTFINELTINKTDTSGFPQAVALAKTSDVVILAIGEDCWQSGEGRSQVDISLVGVQEQLFDAIHAVNPNIVVVLMNGRPLAIPHVAEKTKALVEAWHLGSQAGHGIADVLFGDYNPAGKLPMSFPRSTGQVPIYYNHKITGRPTQPDGLVFYSHYTDEKNTPLYPFGFGLSYTTFSYSNLRLSANSIPANGKVTVQVDVKNTGSRAGEEVVQCYIRDLVASYIRPVKELKGFQKINLTPGQTETVTFTIDSEALGYYLPGGKFVVEPGEFTIFAGSSSTETLEAKLTVQE